jgi:glycosyltransferase involved in cell wall biosynthesis
MINTPHQSKICDRPLVTFALFTYNQEKYIQEAIEGALAQTYYPLEIIISDDDSSDSTFEYCKNLVAGYSGPHNVELHRNPRNLGVITHMNRVLNLVRGELVVMAAGDDVSLPNRTAHTVAEWLKFGRPAGIASAARLVDAEGEPLGVVAPCPHLKETVTRDEQMIAFAREPLLSLLGCTAAWSRSTWESFGPLPPDCRNEDNILTLRSILLGGVRLIVEPLVDYRSHGSNVWNYSSGALPIRYKDISANECAVQRKASMHLKSLTGSLQDLQTARVVGILSQQEYDELLRACVAEIKRLELRENWWSLGFAAKYRALNHLREDMRTRYSMLLPQVAHFSVTSVRHQFKRIRSSFGK